MPFQAKEREGMLTGWIAGRIFWQLECINLPVERPQLLLELHLVDIFGVLGEQTGTRQLQRPQGCCWEAGNMHGPWAPLGASVQLHAPSWTLQAGMHKDQSGGLRLPECPSMWIEGMVPQADLGYEDISCSLAFRSKEGIPSPPR